MHIPAAQVPWPLQSLGQRELLVSPRAGLTLASPGAVSTHWASSALMAFLQED